MADDFSGLSDNELEQAREATRRLLDNVRHAIETFESAPLPKDPIAREQLLESHNKIWLATEASLIAIDALAFERGLIK